MILVDTNVWSEAFRLLPNEIVRAWAARNSDDLWLSTVVIGELLSGVEMMPMGRKRLALEDGCGKLVALHANRIVPFDLAAALRYGPVLVQQEGAGRNPGTADTQIAATALAYGMKLATRNTKHFDGLGLDLIDPWIA